MQLALIQPDTQQLEIPQAAMSADGAFINEGTIHRPRLTVVAQGRALLVSVGNAMAYRVRLLKRPGKGGRRARVEVVYLGFADQQQASAIAQRLRNSHEAYIVERPAKHLPQAFEIKVCAQEATALEIVRAYEGIDLDAIDTSEYRKQAAAVASADALSRDRDWRSSLDALRGFTASTATNTASTPRPPHYLSFRWDRRNSAAVYLDEVPVGHIIRGNGAAWTYKLRGYAWTGDFATWQEAAIALDNYRKHRLGMPQGYFVEWNPALAGQTQGSLRDAELTNYGSIWQPKGCDWQYKAPGSGCYRGTGSKTPEKAIAALLDHAAGRCKGISII